MTNADGTLNIHHNWIKTSWVDSHNGSASGTVNDQGNNLTGSDQLIVDFGNQDFNLLDNSPLIDAGIAIPAIHLPDHDLLNEYVIQTNSVAKQILNTLDIGAFENQSALSITDLSQERIVLYPNPSHSLVFLKNIEPNKIKSIAFYSVNGQLVLTSTDTAIDVTGILSGIYFVKVNTFNTQAILRFIKQ